MVLPIQETRPAVSESAASAPQEPRDGAPDSTTDTIKAGALVAGSLTPGVGEAIDLYTLLHPDSTVFDRGLSAASLAVSVLTLGASPNFGAYAKIARLMDGDAQKIARASGLAYRAETPGRPGAWNSALQPKKRGPEGSGPYHPFDPNTIYEVGPFIYQTDRNGVVERVRGTLQRQPSHRDSGAQRAAGERSRMDEDHGGHVIGTRFGGPGEGINLFAQHRAKNLGEYRRIENEWQRALASDPNAVVTVDVQLVPGNDQRSIKLLVNSWVDGRPLHVDRAVNNFDQPL